AVVDARGADRVTGRDPDVVGARGHGMVRSLLVAAILTGVLPGPAFSRPVPHAIEPACTQGKWTVVPGRSGVEVMILAPSGVAVGSDCPPGTGRLRAVKVGDEAHGAAPALSGRARARALRGHLAAWV